MVTVTSASATSTLPC
ncbi:hypothetical protein HPJ56_15625, partial [Acinetobacter baumannii]|nr:hypothetical protein [Acinetobacter baumannii]